MRKTTCNLTRFDIYDGYYVEVVPCNDAHGDGQTIEFTLSKNGSGFKTLMFSLDATKCPESKWEEIVASNVDDYIEIFEEWEDALERAFCDDVLDDCDVETDAIYEGIKIYNCIMDDVHALGKALLEQYPNVEETPVNDAIYLCCEANSDDDYDCEYMTDSDWHVVDVKKNKW